jgi:hypothetical protein
MFYKLISKADVGITQFQIDFLDIFIVFSNMFCKAKYLTDFV